MQALWKNSIQYEENNPTSTADMEARVSKGDYILLAALTYLHTLATKLCNTVVAKDTMFPASNAFVLPKGSPYIPHFNKKFVAWFDSRYSR